VDRHLSFPQRFTGSFGEQALNFGNVRGGEPKHVDVLELQFEGVKAHNQMDFSGLAPLDGLSISIQ
jgi:hypothetical protein